jgi:hypothetical protein
VVLAVGLRASRVSVQFSLEDAGRLGEFLAGLGAVVAAFVAIWALSVQRRAGEAQLEHARTAAAVQVLTTLEGQWAGPAMLQYRGVLARSLKGVGPAIPPVVADAAQIEILSFFDKTGLLVRNKALTPDLAWGLFSDAAWYYWLGCSEFIRTLRRSDTLYYEDFQHLMCTFLAIDRQRKAKRITASNTRSYFQFEAERDLASLVAPSTASAQREGGMLQSVMRRLSPRRPGRPPVR